MPAHKGFRTLLDAYITLTVSNTNLSNMDIVD